MSKVQFCLGASLSFTQTVEEQVRLFQKCGFDAFFVAWNDKLPMRRALADELGMTLQSVHAPFSCAANMWREDDLGRLATEELLTCVEDTARVHVPILVIHPYKGFAPASPTDAGVENFGKVVARAGELGVKIAFENVEGEEYLALLMERLGDSPAVGFCWDTGHELCYNDGKDMLALYGDRLFHTHLNDNIGVTGENIYWTDDLHLVPTDGKADWKGIAHRIDKTSYRDLLMCELTLVNKPNKHTHDGYIAMKIEDFYAYALDRVQKAFSL